MTSIKKGRLDGPIRIAVRHLPLRHRRSLAHSSSLVKQPLRRTTSRHANSAPGLVRAPGSARSLLPFPPPPMRGGGAPRAPCPWLPMGGPGLTGRHSRKRSDASLRGCVGDTLARHAASLRFRVHGGRTRPRLSPRPVLPGGRPSYVAWRQRREPRTQVPHPAPPFERLAK